MAYLEYVQTYGKRSPKLRPADAYNFILNVGMTLNQVAECSYSDDISESNWYAAVYNYASTVNESLSLYDRCSHERKMRHNWKSFRIHFQYVEPRTLLSEPHVPPLPPLTP